METKPNNAIDFETISIEDAAKVGSPAEQPKMAQEQLDARYSAPQPADVAPEDVALAQKVLESLQVTPEAYVEAQPSMQVQTAQEPTMTPDDFVKKHGGYAYGTPRDVQGAADFLKERRIGTAGKVAMVGSAAGAAALAVLGAPIIAEAGGIGAILASGGLVAGVGVAVPAIATGVALYYAGKGIRNFLVERKFKKLFGRQVDEPVHA